MAIGLWDQKSPRLYAVAKLKFPACRESNSDRPIRNQKFSGLSRRFSGMSYRPTFDSLWVYVCVFCKVQKPEQVELRLPDGDWIKARHPP